MDLVRIAARIAAREDTGALPEDWKLITEEQIEEVMKRMPPGTEIYGSQATGKARPGSDLDIKLPSHMNENDFVRLILKTMRDLDLYIGAINVSMPCDKHAGCMIVAHIDEGNLIPPYLEHLKNFKENPEDLSPEVKEMRENAKKNIEKFLAEEEDDSYFRLTDYDKEVIDRYLAENLEGDPEKLFEDIWRDMQNQT